MKVCIYTQQNVEGKIAVPVKEDRIIHTIRSIKKFFGIAQMNELYVSQEHLEQHRKRRKSFERSMLFASVLAGVIAIAILLSPVLSGRFDVWAFVSALVIGTFVLCLPLFKYSPALQDVEPQMISSAPVKKTVTKQAKKPKKKNKVK